MKQLRAWTKALAFVGFLAGATAGCSSSSSDDTTADAPQTSTNEAIEAKAEFWQKFGGGDLQGALTAQQKMIAAYPANPQDDELARLIGFAYLLGVGTANGPPTKPDPAALQNSIHYAQLAVDNAPTPAAKNYDSGFLGGFGYSVASFSGDTAAQENYRQLIENVTRSSIPAFGYLTRADVMAGAAKGSADFASSLESYFRFYEVCTGKQIDRKNPDPAALLTRPFVIDDPACGNSTKVPHNASGSLMNLADAMVKAGNIEGAKPVYAAIKRSEGFAGWNPSFAKVVDERLAGDLKARAAEYDKPGNPMTQPFIGVGCGGCHQR
jgi:hypothetical protein